MKYPSCQKLFDMSSTFQVTFSNLKDISDREIEVYIDKIMEPIEIYNNLILSILSALYRREYLVEVFSLKKKEYIDYKNGQSDVQPSVIQNYFGTSKDNRLQMNSRRVLIEKERICQELENKLKNTDE